MCLLAAVDGHLVRITLVIAAEEEHAEQATGGLLGFSSGAIGLVRGVQLLDLPGDARRPLELQVERAGGLQRKAKIHFVWVRENHHKTS